MVNRILMVEDDEKIIEIVQDYFQVKSKDEMELVYAKDGDLGLSFFYKQKYDLILLDVMLPGTNGFELCQEIRKFSDIPIIFITARGAEEDRIRGYRMGCDDYVVKPFSLGELFYKVQAVIRRSKGMVGSDNMTAGVVTINPFDGKVTVNGKQVELAPKEFELLKYLMERKNRLISREELLTGVWGFDFFGSDRVVDNHVKKLRKALGNSGSLIKTVVKKGYRLEDY